MYTLLNIFVFLTIVHVKFISGINLGFSVWSVTGLLEYTFYSHFYCTPTSSAAVGGFIGVLMRWLRQLKF